MPLEKDIEANADLVNVLSGFINFIGNERVRAYNEGVDAERERCAIIAEGLNGWGEKGSADLANHIAKIIRRQSHE